MRKPNLLFLAAAIACLSIPTACGKKAVPVSDVAVAPSVLTILDGGTETLTAMILPKDATDKSVTWISGNTDVVTVEGGLVTAVHPGMTTVTVITRDGGKMASCTVTVEPVRVGKVELTPTLFELEAGKTRTLIATVLPENATNKDVAWESDDTTVATVRGGVVTAVGEGTTFIKVVTDDGGKTATSTVRVTGHQ